MLRLSATHLPGWQRRSSQMQNRLESVSRYEKTPTIWRAASHESNGHLQADIVREAPCPVLELGHSKVFIVEAPSLGRQGGRGRIMSHNRFGCLVPSPVGGTQLCPIALAPWHRPRARGGAPLPPAALHPGATRHQSRGVISL